MDYISHRCVYVMYKSTRMKFIYMMVFFIEKSDKVKKNLYKNRALDIAKHSSQNKHFKHYKKKKGRRSR